MDRDIQARWPSTDSKERDCISGDKTVQQGTLTEREGVEPGETIFYKFITPRLQRGIDSTVRGREFERVRGKSKR